MIDIKLFFKSLFVSNFSDIVASLLSDYKLTVDFGLVRMDHYFIRGKSELRHLKVFIQIEWSVFGIDYQRICAKNNLWTDLYVNWIAFII